MQNQVVETFKTKVLPQLEAELDRWVPENETLRIDRLELDLGRIRSFELDQSFPEKFMAKFREEIQRITVQGAQIQGVAQQSAVLHELEILMYYLERGYLPWQVKASDFRLAEYLIRAIEAGPQALESALLQAGKISSAGSRVWRRLATGLNTDAFQQLIRWWTPSLETTWSRIKMELNSDAVFQVFRRAGFSKQEWQVALRESFLLLGLASKQASFKSEVLTHIGLAELPNWAAEKQVEIWVLKAAAIHLLSARGSISELRVAPSQMTAWVSRFFPSMDSQLRSRLPQIGEGLEAGDQEKWGLAFQESWRKNLLAKSNPDLSTFFQIWIQEFQALVAPSTARSNSPALELVLKEMAQYGVKIELDAPKQIELVSPQKATQRKRNSRMEEAHYVQNAGLVLLNPFLQTAFEGFGWMENASFKDELAQENALWFVQLLGSKSPVESEAELLLAKILVGMAPETPVRSSHGFETSVLEEADTLLQAAIGYWNKIGNISPNDFRQAFILREGRLKDGGGSWQLKVERQTLDVLMEFLPWSIGVIRLPWMEQLLAVDW